MQFHLHPNFSLPSGPFPAQELYVHVASTFPLAHHYQSGLACGSGVATQPSMCSPRGGMVKIPKQGNVRGKYVLTWFRPDDLAKEEKPLRD
jgi:hypothetical protein